MIYKVRTAIECCMANEALRRRLASLGKPQPPLSREQRLYMKPASQEFERLTQLLAQVSPVEANKEAQNLQQLLVDTRYDPESSSTSTYAPVGDSQKFTPMSAAPQTTGAPSFDESKLATAVAAVIAHQATPPAGGLTLEVLAATVDAVWGKGMAANLTQRPIEILRGHASKEDLAAAPYNEAAATRVMAALTANAKAQIAAQSMPEAQSEDFQKLRVFCHRAGIKVPGLSYKGLRPATAEQTLEAASLKIAQARVDAFLAVLSGEDCSGEHADVVEFARRFITKATGQPYTVGATLNLPR
jgi:hypothetical protein